MLQEQFGGSVTRLRERQRLDGKRTRDAFKWTLHGLQAKQFLEYIQPFAFVKKEPLRIGLEFCTLMDARRNRLSDENRERRRQLYHELRAINTHHYYPTEAR